MSAIGISTYASALVIEDGATSKVPAPVLNELWEELLIEHGRCPSRVISNSMYPVIKRGDRVLVESARSDKVRFGDIIVFKKNGKLLTHRALGKRELNGQYHLLEKGDANLVYTFIPAHRVIGRVTVISNSGRNFQTISGTGRLLQLILACISFSSLRLWAALEYCLTKGKRNTYRPRYGAAYRRILILLYRTILRLFR
jgi:signal peptidase I